MTTDLVTRARAGDSDAFREMTQPHHRELQVHCYRMLGSVQDSEDALQETLLAAWQGLDGFEARASVRTWLYRIATNRCLNARRSASRRPTKEWDTPAVEPPEPTRFGEIPWLEPYPDSLLEGAIDVPLGPEARYAQTEAISLAFVSALQVLPRRQLGVLTLRDVLGFRANEVAEMLDTTVESVNSALKRARASVQRSQPSVVEREPAPASGSTSEQALVEKFVRAYESGDVGALVALLTTDIFVSMPPIPLESKASTRCPACSPASSAQAEEWTWCRRAPTVSRPSTPTFAPAPAFGIAAACSSSPSPATGFAPSRASTAACSRGSGCRDRCPADSASIGSGCGVASCNCAACSDP